MGNGYGCWCYFFENYKHGHGKPKSEVDTACKVLADGYKCIELDAKANNMICNPQETTYSDGGHFLSGCYDSSTGLELPEGSCERNVCEVEMMFVQTMFQISTFGLQGADIDGLLGHNTGFDATNECQHPGGTPRNTPRPELICCGSSYPMRFP